MEFNTTQEQSQPMPLSKESNHNVTQSVVKAEISRSPARDREPTHSPSKSSRDPSLESPSKAVRAEKEP